MGLLFHLAVFGLLNLYNHLSSELEIFPRLPKYFQSFSDDQDQY